MRFDIPGPVHAHVNMTMRRIINEADQAPVIWEPDEMPKDRDQATRHLAAFIEMVQIELRYRWRESPHFLAVPEWVRNALLRYPHLTDTLTVIPGWDNPPPHDTTGLWHAIAFLTTLSPLETLLSTRENWTNASTFTWVFPCNTKTLTPLLDPTQE